MMVKVPGTFFSGSLFRGTDRDIDVLAFLPMSALTKLSAHFSEVSRIWDQEIIPVLVDYVRIPNKSPAFDPEWKAHGHMDAAMRLLIDWVKAQPIAGLQWQLLESPGRTPLLFIEVPGELAGRVLLYGHMDKQPEMSGWDPGTGPWQPVIKNDRLYGRGAADDGYALFAALTAIRALQDQKLAHPHCMILIEASEESGSDDLPFYLNQLQAQIGTPELVLCLDSGCGDYQRLWSTTSLRGNITGKLSIKVLNEGIHSGYGSGVVANPFLILRHLLARIENDQSGKILLEGALVTIPEERLQQTEQTAQLLDPSFKSSYPFAADARALHEETYELLLNRNWRAALSVTGLNGLPAIEQAGNVTVPELSVKLSLRTPPTADAQLIAAELQTSLENNPPFKSQVKFETDHVSFGWHAPLFNAQLAKSCNAASEQFFGEPMAFIGEGGTIPFMAMLGKQFPNTQFLITGVLGPHSNAHGPNEFLDIPYVKKITACLAAVLAGL